MDVPPSMDLLIHLVKELRGHLRALLKAVAQDAEADVIDEVVSRCSETVALLQNVGNSFSTVWENDEEQKKHAHALFTELWKDYQTCMKTLATASARTAQELAGMQKIESASRQYQKIAHLV
ncbi:hypothetical protein [Desulfosoma caldarium]|uniref:Uncharacterized protein n=1 Tax=Desulfosoma caldarium TaxID=610254 RepID=A0A3N1UMY4_9BACT|nr:hypothetical protein [Desulfosoma caldarium]ROQ90759.1 hypothetical protein EDC27_2649 [Desulfosoma caldarium]